MVGRLPGEGYGHENETYIGNRLQFDDEMSQGAEGFLGNSTHEAWHAWWTTTVTSWLLAWVAVIIFAVMAWRFTDDPLGISSSPSTPYSSTLYSSSSSSSSS